MYIVVDTETTGLDPDNGGIVEIATVGRKKDGSLSMISAICDPGMPIEHQAMAAHHITEEMISGTVSSQSTLESIMRVLREETEDLVMVAHNAEFDRGFLSKLDSGLYSVPWVCTYRCALHMWPEAPAHSNQVLRYFLNLDDLEIPINLYPHRALYDAIVTEGILRTMLETHPIEKLLELTKTPVVLHKVRFGKHKDMLWKNVPSDYLKWVVRQDDMDADVRHTATHYLHK
jgi:exodeoxyribonuclease X